MKKKIVLWAQEGEDKKILLGIELDEKESKVLLHKFSEEDATEDFYNQMMNQWRSNQEISFPGSHTIEERPLSLTEDILPENIRTERTDVISRAKAEWHFVVLSSKLYDMYKSEVEEIKEKVENLTEYDDGIWNDMKEFWSKVQNQVYDRNLFRDHAQSLREDTNQLFDTLKQLKNDMQRELRNQSKVAFGEFTTMLDNVQEKLDKNLGLKPIFEELKDIQSKFKQTSFVRDHGNKIWNRMDKYFKIIKEQRFGDSATNQSGQGRTERRLNGLLSAIDKMQASIKRDEKDLAYQNRRIEETDGQLERELGKAKVMIIQERMNSKNEKLMDMMKTKEQLEQKRVKEEAMAAKKAEQAEIEKAKEAAKSKIAQEMEDAQQDVDKSKLSALATDINESKSRKKKPAKKTSEEEE